MGVSDTRQSSDYYEEANQTDSDDYFDRAKEMKAFADTKTGVKGLVDAGIVRVPKIFIRPPEDLAMELAHSPPPPHLLLQVPVIDLEDHKGVQIVEKVREASETWGIFQVVNHGVPLSLMEEMIEAARMFHEQQDVEAKKEFFSYDNTKGVRYFSTFNLISSKLACWKDTLSIYSSNVNPEELPPVCRDVTVEYQKRIKMLGETLLDLLSRALGLKSDHLNDLNCLKTQSLLCHYYPRCPEPHLTIGAERHQDPDFLTILLQDQIGGLQFFYQNHWVDVHPIHGALIVNIGDFLQIVSNGKFKSIIHRVMSKNIGPRISIPTFFYGEMTPTKHYGPIKELLSEENPPLYKDFLVSEYLSSFRNAPLNKYPLGCLKIE